MRLLAGVLGPAHRDRASRPLVVPRSLLRHPAPPGFSRVEAPDVRDAPTGYLNDARRLRRRRALANLRDIAAGRPEIPLAEILTPAAFLNDGHHRLVASRMLGTFISAEVHGLPAAGRQDRRSASAGHP